MHARSPWPSHHADIVAAWQQEVRKSVRTPWLLPQLVQRGAELGLRFADLYRQLQALPRRVRRALQGKLARSLAGVALLLALGPTIGQAATITVDGTACTLVDAIIAANTNADAGGCTLVGTPGADTITLPSGTQTLSTINNSTFGPTGLPVVTSTITITGNSSTIARSADVGTPDFRLLAVASGGNLTLENLTLTGGVVTTGTHPDNKGGGVINRGGTLTVLHSTVTGNSASGDGGGVASYGGTLTITESTISGNSAAQGGGVYNGSSNNSTVTNTTISNNRAQLGGGVYNNTFQLLTLNHSTVSGNSASSKGGGVYHYYGSLDLNRTLVSGNIASQGQKFSTTTTA